MEPDVPTCCALAFAAPLNRVTTFYSLIYRCGLGTRVKSCAGWHAEYVPVCFMEWQALFHPLTPVELQS